MNVDFAALIADLERRRDAIEHLIRAIKAAMGDVLLPTFATPPAPALGDVVARQASRPPPSMAHPNRDEARTEAILAMLADEPLGTRDIAKRLRQDRLVVKQALQRLKKSGVLTTIGVGPGTKYTRAKATGPARPPAAMGPRAVAAERAAKPTDEAMVKARDAAVFSALKTAGRTGLSFTELLPVLPDAGLVESQRAETLTMVLRRLRAKANGVEFGEDQRWRLMS